MFAQQYGLAPPQRLAVPSLRAAVASWEPAAKPASSVGSTTDDSETPRESPNQPTVFNPPKLFAYSATLPRPPLLGGGGMPSMGVLRAPVGLTLGPPRVVPGPHLRTEGPQKPAVQHMSIDKAAPPAPETKVGHVFTKVETKLMALQIRFDGDFEVCGRPLFLDVLHPTDAGETGWRVWDAGIVLAKWAERQLCPSQGQGSTILELGCGSGVAGLGAALAGHSVILTDKDAISERTKRNIQMNANAVAEAGGHCAYATLDWNAPASWEAFPEEIDYIFAADVVWAQPFVKMFLTALRGVLERCSKQPEIVFAHKDRDPAVLEAFLKALPEYGFRLRERLHSGGLDENDPYFHDGVMLYFLEKA